MIIRFDYFYDWDCLIGLDEWTKDMLSLAIELCLEKAGEIVSGLETLTNIPSVKITADQLNEIRTQINDIEVSQLTEMSSSFLANES